METITRSPEETSLFAQKFCEEHIKDAKGPIIVELIGDLGAGKTTFMKGVGEYFGVKEEIISPTFLIQRNYVTQKGEFKNLVHIDAYRIEKPEELESLDWNKYSKDEKNIIFVEWPGNMQIPLNPDFVIEFSHETEIERKIKVKNAKE